MSSAFSFPFPATVLGISSAAAAASSAAASRSIVSISKSMTTRFTSSAVSASTLLASAGVASAAAELSMAAAFDADASGGVCSITSTTRIILHFLAHLASSLPKAPSPSEKASSDVALVDLA
jgi:hypothetical protein